MRLLGDAAVAMWWNVAEENLGEFHDWHSREHLPERLGIPGFNRGSRWQQPGGGDFFVLYELETYDTLISDGYRARLNAPTPWSTKMMPLHLQMVRSQCRIICSHGGGLATFISTIRLSPATGRAGQLEEYVRVSVEHLSHRLGVTGAHLLRTETPASEPTTEQKIRGGDAVADWIVLVAGHDDEALREITEGSLGGDALRHNGAARSQAGEPYRIVHAMVPQDV